MKIKIIEGNKYKERVWRTAFVLMMFLAVIVAFEIITI
jgi:hypothetical protein